MGIEIVPHEVLLRAFPGIHDNEAGEMAQLGEILHCPAGTVLCHEGAFETIFYILLRGEVCVTKELDGSTARVMKHLGPGDFFGEMAIIHKAPRAATVTTTEPTTVLAISKDIFSNMLERSSSVSLAIVREVSRRLRENDEMAIGDLRLKAKELADAYQHLAELEYARHEFLTTIAHELRTPLMAANGFLQIIRSGNLQGASMQMALETVSRNMQDIVSLTNDILFLQEMDLILPEFEMVDIGSVVANSVEQQRYRAENNRVGLKLVIAPNLPNRKANPQSLGRAFSAVIDNAIKFSPDGGEVIVEVNRRNEGITVAVIDHGVGIPEEALPRIFERFFHLDEINGHLFRGVGLGLSIARQVIELHKGTLTVESQQGKGSCFTITL